jgi:hypothetical protein
MLGEELRIKLRSIPKSHNKPRFDNSDSGGRYAEANRFRCSPCGGS